MNMDHINHKPLVLSCAGFDPSAGAGLLGDLRAFEAMGAYGMAVETCSTVQNDCEFFSIQDRMDEAFLQMDALARRFKFRAVKIGLVPSWPRLAELLERIRFYWPSAPILWDPILKASAGFDFAQHQGELESLLSLVDYWTPNLREIAALYPDLCADELYLQASQSAALYLKGGHADGDLVLDRIYKDGELIWELELPRLGGEKHGSGCHLSALFAASLALGGSVQECASRARLRLQDFFSSAEGLLGYYP